MESSQKYWTKIQSRSSQNDPEYYNLSELEYFTVSEKQWLRDNLNPKKVTIIMDIFSSSGKDVETPVIELQFDPRKGPFSWFLYKYKDDWFLLTDEGDEFYRCDGLKGLKKLLEELKFLK